MLSNRYGLVRVAMAITMGLGGCSPPEARNAPTSRASAAPRGAEPANTGAKRTLKVGKIQAAVKHDTVQQAEGRLFLVNCAASDIPDEVKAAVNTSLERDASAPVLWVHLSVNVDGIIKAIRQRDPNAEGFKKDDFAGVVNGAKLSPRVLAGTVEVNGTDRFLQQDLVFEFPPDADDLQVVVSSIVLAEFELLRED